MATFKRPRASDQEARDDHSPPRLDCHWHQKLRGDTAPLSLRGKADFRVFVKGVERMFSGSVLSGADGDERAKCMTCNVSFSVCHGGATMYGSTSALLRQCQHRVSDRQLILGYMVLERLGKQGEQEKRRTNSSCKYSKLKRCLYSLPQSAFPRWRSFH